jgi:hypothetical protein
VDEHHLALHPPLLGDLAQFDRIARAEVSHCNICAQSFPAFLDPDGAALCPQCGSDRRARSLYRALAESVLLYRRLPALGIDLPEGIRSFWKEQFQGKMLTAARTARPNGSGFPDDRVALAGLGEGPGISGVMEEAVRVLAPGGTLFIAGAVDLDGADARAAALDLVPIRRTRYASAVIRYDWSPVLIYRRPDPQDATSG